MTTTTDLVKRLEAGDTGREIDAEIMFDFFAKPVASRGRIKAYLWPEDSPSWSFGLWCEPDRREKIIAARKHHDETLLIERDGGLVLMNSLRVPNLTTSLDAAVALVERVRPGAWIQIDGPRKYLEIPTPVPNRWRGVVEPWDGKSERIGWGSTPAAALIAALLKAKGAGDE